MTDKMEKTFVTKLRTVLTVFMVGLAAVLLSYLWVTPNVEVHQRQETAAYETAAGVSCRKVEDPSAPIGIRREFRFPLKEEIGHDTVLVFTFSHQEAEVYLEEEPVYTLEVSEQLQIIRTPGVNWAVIPLDAQDAGKEVRAVLTPVYADYQDQEIQFLIGSKLAIYQGELEKALPELLLSMVDFLIGLILFGTAVYFSFQKETVRGFYALAFLAVSLGLWNFTQEDVLSLFLPHKTVFVYYLSLTMLMCCMVPMIKSIKKSGKPTMERLLECWCLLCVCVSGIQQALQLAGICDLREMLKVTHAMISISAMILICSSIRGWFANQNKKQRETKDRGVWLLGAGALIDMLLYYRTGGSSHLLFVLIAIFCYVLMEGIQMIFSYTRQKQQLEEKEQQLMLSRIATMMSQIRSHFVFNILNAISGMCKYDPEKADETIVRFARYLRNNIDIMEDDRPILFSTELLRLEDYVILEQIRFGDKIEFLTDVKIDSFLIPPLILQPVIENAIKHGLTKKAGGGTVILRTWEEETQIKISVEDDGVGFAPEELEKEGSVGLKNIRYRLKHLVQGSLDVESQVGKGTVVTISLPKKEKEICKSFM